MGTPIEAWMAIFSRYLTAIKSDDMSILEVTALGCSVLVVSWYESKIRCPV